jgi:hypothetical protein
MRINNKFIITISIIFMVIGLILSVVGFAMSGFSIEAYERDTSDWFQVINFYAILFRV